ncbi:hypothetical protein F4678DRAFT_452172 [Xylaria arbuscula]|nr:hypothetical protein F4678DRAFT_452172 [Xylaria arbuscula]
MSVAVTMMATMARVVGAVRVGVGVGVGVGMGMVEIGVLLMKVRMIMLRMVMMRRRAEEYRVRLGDTCTARLAAPETRS